MFGMKMKYHGIGSFRFAGTATDFAGECSIRISLAGRQEIELSMLDWKGDSLEYLDVTLNSDRGPAEFSGTLDDGTPFRAKQMGLREFRPPSFIPSEFEVGVQRPAKRIRLFIANLVVAKNWEARWEDGHPATYYHPWIFDIPALPHPYTAELKMRKDSANLAPGKESRSQRCLTCVLDITSSAGLLDWRDIEEPIYRICNLFSLAAGRTVNWVAARGTCKEGTDWWIHRRHSLSSFPEKQRLLDIDSHPGYFRALLRCLPRILSFSDSEMNGFRRALHLHYHSPGIYEFPVPFYVYGGAFEALCEAFCKGKQSGYIGDERTCREIRDSFVRWAEETMIPAAGDLADELRQNLKTKFAGLNNRYLKQRIEALCLRFGEEYDREAVKNFVDQRNSDTHGSFLVNDLRALHQKVEPIEGLLGRLLLRAVGYEGEYWDNKRGWWTLYEMK